ncbi:roquin-1 isoform X2 [Strongylocentrotus purpuratus]|uniref:RING-type E3 ubiquitin transferase n=1 Tax=Strongylocentrotus purpuratus TaxID=7668 RepID=A0A7M7T4C6_STRPU|nr:roquin-1 isoform X2 [Strongylocentrotus purpuratus]|eukprot:XP_011662687.1 PREDICTED: roquin-1 isoform X2 [Strongylocentrotus purpuratus]
MPVQTPQWTEVLSCPVCCKDFSPSGRQPVSLSCGHTACRMCLSKLHRQQCPFDQTPISKDVDKLPTNFAILQLVAGQEVMRDPSRKRIPDGLKPAEFENYQTTQGIIEELALYLKALNKPSSGSLNGTLNGNSGSPLLSRPIQRKLVTLVNCQLIEGEGRARVVRAARSLGERIVTELIIQHQNPQQLSTNLWAAVRARGCQFLGPAMQEETLKLVLLALEDGTPLSRKVLVMFVVQKLEMQFPQASKTSVGHVVQLLYRASCFKVTKREEESSLMQLKEEFRNYDSLRREHDTQIVQIAIEAGLRISPEQWSSLLYGDLNHKSHMQSIIDKLQTPASFTSSIQELTICLQRSGDPVRLAQLHAQLEKLAAIDPSPGAMISSWEGILSALDSVRKVLKGLMEFLQNYSQNKKALDLQTQNIKYKTSLCRDVMQKGGCPRGPSCTFAHSEEELEKYRSKSRQLLSSLNSQNKNSNVSRGDGSLLSEGNNETSTQSMPGSSNGKPPRDQPIYSLEECSAAARLGSESLYSSVSGLFSDQQERSTGSAAMGYKSESGRIHRPPLSAFSQLASSERNEDELRLDEDIQASLYGLRDRNEQSMTTRKELSSPTPGLPPHLEYPNILPSSNTKMYLASRSLSMNASEPSVGREDSERTSSVGGGRVMHHEAKGRRPGPDIDRYALPPEEGYFYERRMPSNEAPAAYGGQGPSPHPPPQPHILVPTMPPQPQGDPYDRKPDKHPYPYHAPSGGGYLYPESQVMPQTPPPEPPRQYRRPVVQRYVDPHTMKAYDVVPVDDYVEPSAPPPSLLPSQRYKPQPMYHGEPDFYPPYDQRGHRITDMRHLPPVGTPQGNPSHLIPDDSSKRPEMKGGKLPSHKVAVSPPKPKPPLRLERGPSLTELKERQTYLVTRLDEIQDDTDTKDDEPVTSTPWSRPATSSSTNPPTSLWAHMADTQPSWTTSSSRALSDSLWGTSTESKEAISSTGLSFSFTGIEDEEEEEDIDHRKNGIDVDAEEEIETSKFTDDDETTDQADRSDSEVGSYNPWTSTSLFMPNTGKAVKETATNYTMTYSKVLVRHVSANEDDPSQRTPHGSHQMGDYEKMSMHELERTLKEVGQQDQRAGSSHFERGHKIQIEMGRREEDGPTPSPHFSSNSVPLPAQLVSKEPILHMYTKYPHAGALAASYGPVSGSARALGSNTGPLKVSAGMVENTMPVNMTQQDCQVAPGFQTPEGDGYYIKTPKAPSAELEATILKDDWETTVEKLVECDPQAQEKLKQALSQVRTRIQAKETAKHAHNTFIIDFEEKILENMNCEKDHRPVVDCSHGDCSHGGNHVTHQVKPPQNVSVQQPESRAVQMQESGLSRYARQPDPHHVRQPDPHPRDPRDPRDSHWMPQRGGSPGHAPGYQYVEPHPHMDGYTSPKTPYPRLVPAGSRQTRYGPPPPGPASHVQVERQGIHASKRQMEAADLQYAKQVQDKEREEYLRHLEDVQRRHDQMDRMEQQKRTQEERDRKIARELAMREAMYNNYP